MPKTGTTSLQHGLFCDRQRLCDHNILYPVINNEQYHWPLMLPFLSCPENHHLVRKQGFSKKQLNHFVKQYLQDLYQQLEDSNPHLCILSNEGFSDLNAKELHFFKNFLDRLFLDYRIVVYHRKASSLYSSYVQELLKAGVLLSELPDPLHYRSKTANVISAYTDCFAERVTVIPFDSKTLLNGSTIDDFYHRFVSLKPPTVARQNVSLPKSIVIAFGVISQTIPRFTQQTTGENPVWSVVRQALKERAWPEQEKFTVPQAWMYTIAKNHGEDLSTFEPVAPPTRKEFIQWFLAQMGPETWIKIIQAVALFHLTSPQRERQGPVEDTERF